MERSSKRRASIEVQELMNSVKKEYEVFSRCEALFQRSPLTNKRQRNMSDEILVRYADIRSTSRHNQGFDPRYKNRLQTKLWNDDEQLPLYPQHPFLQCEESFHRQKLIEQQSRKDKEHSHDGVKYLFERHVEPRSSNNFTRKNFTCGVRHASNDDFLSGISTRQYFNSIPPQLISTRRHTHPCVTNKHESEPETIELGSKEQFPFYKSLIFQRKSSEDFGERNGNKRNEEGKDTSPHSFSQAMVYRATEKIPPTDKEEEHRTTPVEMTRILQEHQESIKKLPHEDIFNEVEIMKIPKLTSTERPLSTSPNSSDPTQPRDTDRNETKWPTNEKKSNETKKEIVPMEYGGPKHYLVSSPSGKLSPDHVVTRVGSLLWLDKEIVYPITLHEMRRRIEDPENFSFQMLIAYVRHSRAKGRQFLDYWNCRPSSKTSRPNVLSKLCEADAMELVKGIEKLNEEYFPKETLAKNAAVKMLGDKIKKGKMHGREEETSTKWIMEKELKKIEKTRLVFKILRNTLSKSQDDERFHTFKVASHDAGVANLKSSLKFLESILERIQDHVQEGYAQLPALTA